MELKNYSICLLCSLLCFIVNAQDGPGGIGNTTGTSNLQLWLNASDLEADHQDEDKVVHWADRSGAGNDVLVPFASAPVFKSNVLPDFSGVEFQGNEYLQTASPSSSFKNPESTIFITIKGNFSGTPIAIASNGWANEMLLFNNEQYHHSASGNFTRLSHDCIEDVSEDEFSVICAVFGETPDDLRYIVNGLETTLPIASFGSAIDFENIDRKVTIGNRDQFVFNEYFEGTLLEVIVYNTKLTDEEILSVEDHLRCNYDVLPSVCTELSVEECPTISADKTLDAKIDINITPNPTSEYLHLDIKGDLPLFNMDYTIYDELGRQLLKGNVSNGNSKINVASFTKGFYFLKLQMGNEIITRKFIVEGMQ